MLARLMPAWIRALVCAFKEVDAIAVAPSMARNLIFIVYIIFVLVFAKALPSITIHLFRHQHLQFPGLSDIFK
jgi:hypothetical protein